MLLRLYIENTDNEIVSVQGTYKSANTLFVSNHGNKNLKQKISKIDLVDFTVTIDADKDPGVKIYLICDCHEIYMYEHGIAHSSDRILKIKYNKLLNQFEFHHSTDSIVTVPLDKEPRVINIDFDKSDFPQPIVDGIRIGNAMKLSDLHLYSPINIYNTIASTEWKLYTSIHVDNSIDDLKDEKQSNIGIVNTISAEQLQCVAFINIQNEVELTQPA